jgi:hypothetical protein
MLVLERDRDVCAAETTWDTDIQYTPDKWTWEWKEEDNLPQGFVTSKTLFQQAQIRDISGNQWEMLSNSIDELAVILQLPEIRNRKLEEEGDRRKMKARRRLKVLQLAQKLDAVCNLGLWGSRIVTAASPLSTVSKPFIPYRTYAALQKRNYANSEYYCSYRNFCAKFDIGLTVQNYRADSMYAVGYILQHTIHDKLYVQPLVTVQNFAIAVPKRVTISPDLHDLPGTLQNLNQDAVAFIDKQYWTKCNLQHHEQPRYVETVLRELLVPLDLTYSQREGVLRNCTRIALKSFSRFDLLRELTRELFGDALCPVKELGSLMKLSTLVDISRRI